MAIETDLEKRMRLVVVGQATWPELRTKRRCDKCCRFNRGGITGDRKKMGFGVCDLVKAHTRKRGKEFVGRGAIACRYFEQARNRG